MDVRHFEIDRAAAASALAQYKEHRSTHDSRDWEIERIYRAISKGQVVINAKDAIGASGLTSDGFPRIAIGQAHKDFVFCSVWEGRVEFTHNRWRRSPEWGKVAMPAAKLLSKSGRAVTPRIPPQHRPAQSVLRSYFLLWEADWASVPKDPYLLRRIGVTDMYVVLAEWDLTDVEIAVMRSHMGRLQ
ncbi:MAG TPA: hypothetical protein VGG55_02530 [Candidatus Acidoferrales bacterium]|jgi:hypothetical protein